MFTMGAGAEMIAARIAMRIAMIATIAMTVARNVFPIHAATPEFAIAAIAVTVPIVAINAMSAVETAAARLAARGID